MSALGIASKGELERWRSDLARAPFVDPNEAAGLRDGVIAMQTAIADGFTDFVVLGLRNADADAGAYNLRMFSRPRSRAHLAHILQTAQHYVSFCLVDTQN